jgi:hypothetical protein
MQPQPPPPYWGQMEHHEEEPWQGREFQRQQEAFQHPAQFAQHQGMASHFREPLGNHHGCKMNLKILGMILKEAELIEEEEELAEITLCALLGSSSPSTIRAVACINGHKAIVLIDIGSTHNFLYNNLAKSLKLVIDTSSCFGVKVANGEVIRTKENARQSSSRCKA